MTRKTTTYARKRERTGGTFNGAEFLNAISRCRPYTNEVLPGAVVQEPTQAAADKSIRKVRESFGRLSTGQTHCTDQDDFDRLAHALSVSCIRAGQIAGDLPVSLSS